MTDNLREAELRSLLDLVAAGAQDDSDQGLPTDRPRTGISLDPLRCGVVQRF